MVSLGFDVLLTTRATICKNCSKINDVNLCIFISQLIIRGFSVDTHLTFSGQLIFSFSIYQLLIEIELWLLSLLKGIVCASYCSKRDWNLERQTRIDSGLFLGQVLSDVLKFCVDADRSVSFECVLLFLCFYLSLHGFVGMKVKNVLTAMEN